MGQKEQRSYYYYASGKKIFLTLLKGSYCVVFPDTSQSVLKSKLGKRVTPFIFIVNDTSSLHDYFSKYFVTQGYQTQNGAPIYVDKKIVLLFKDSVSSFDRATLIKNYHLQFLKKSLSSIQYQSDSNTDILSLTNKIYETGLVKYCTPDFLIHVQNTAYYPSDPYFGEQYYLYNTGQLLNDGHYGTPGADIDAPDAWDITKGNSNVVVAVIDGGITSDHPDLPNTRQLRLNGSNFAWYLDGTDPNNPSPTFNPHGDACAGIIAATQDNEGISGIAPLCKIMAIRVGIDNILVQSSDFANAIDFAVTNGANIISNSWTYNDPSNLPNIKTAIQNAIDNGVVVVCSADNTANHVNNDDGVVDFPGNADIDNLITVGASDRNDEQANYSPNGSAIDVAAPSNKATPDQIPGESLDIWTLDMPGNSGINPFPTPGLNPPVAGEILPSTGSNYLAYTGRMSGTSASTAEVSGVAALMLSINPCLTPLQVNNILKNTADKVGGYNYNWDNTHPGQSKELGYGRVNAYKAVKAAQKLHSTTLDLYMKDVPEDFGAEPASYPANTPLWISSDIWTRNQQDGIEQQQNIEYNPNHPAYIYVKIRNKSCVDLPVNAEEVHVYFAKAGTFWANWPYPWTNTGGNPPVGGEIGYADIPAIPAGGEAVLSIPWASVPNPQLYNNWPPNQIHHFCILARIVPKIAGNLDPMYSELIGTSSNNVLSHNLSWNNNIAMKNISIVDFQQFRVDLNTWVLDDHAAVRVGNSLSSVLHGSQLHLDVPAQEYGNPITKDAEVKVLMDSTIWSIWQSGGAQGTGIRIFNPDAHEILITQPHATLTNLTFPPQITGNIAVQFNFLTDQQDGKNNFTYDLTQISDTGALLGGERFQIVRPDSQSPEVFQASVIAQNNNQQSLNTINLAAQSINEPAVYRWYTADTTLIDTGMNFIFNSNSQSVPALLSVTADSNGYKDYVALNVNTLQNNNNQPLQFTTDSIISLSPNPTNNQVTVAYHIGSSNVYSAHLVVTYINNPTVLQAISINTSQSQAIIDVSNLAAGVYVISLNINGQFVDSKQLVVQ